MPAGAGLGAAGVVTRAAGLAGRARRWAGTQARSAARRLWLLRGEDTTAARAADSCLVLAPHADDETLGCGVAIMRRTDAGIPVTIVIATDGELGGPEALAPGEVAELRREEAVRACARLGVSADRLVFLGLGDGRLADSVDDLAARLAEIVAATGPDELLVPVSCDGHPDHEAAHAAVLALVATGRYGGRVLEYPIWMWQRWPWLAGGGRRQLLAEPWRRLRGPRPLLLDARGYRERHRAALDEYASQVHGAGGGVPLPASLLRAVGGRHEVAMAFGAPESARTSR